MNAAMYIKTYFSVFYFVTEEGYRNSGGGTSSWGDDVLIVKVVVVIAGVVWRTDIQLYRLIDSQCLYRVFGWL